MTRSEYVFGLVLATYGKKHLKALGVAFDTLYDKGEPYRRDYLDEYAAYERSCQANKLSCSDPWFDKKNYSAIEEALSFGGIHEGRSYGCRRDECLSDGTESHYMFGSYHLSTATFRLNRSVAAFDMVTGRWFNY